MATETKLCPALEEPPVVHEIAEVFRTRDSFLIIGHLRPDGDCLGSCLGLYEILKNMGKKVRFYTDGPVPEFFRYLPGFENIETTLPAIGPDTVTACVDSADPGRISDTYRPSGFVVNIDHHVSNTCFADLNWVDVEATAAAEQIYRLALVLEQPITPEIATCLYTGIIADTGGFRFSNTDQMTFQAAAHLVKAGANPARIAQVIFESRRPAQVKITGQVYSTLIYEFNGHFVWNELTQEMFAQAGGEEAEPEGLASDIRGIDGVEIAVLFFETPESWCRIGFRSHGRINVSELAQLLGGGGHKAASGAMIREPYQQAKSKALRVIRDYVEKRLPEIL